jgi:predicted DCC family thiol-disulfide oxidoreductase YuxK
MNHVILFDGVCNLCNWAVGFIIRRDPEGKFKFASLQSTYSRNFLDECGFQLTPDFIIYIRNFKIYTKSTAVLMILRDLGGLWKMFYGFIIIPGYLRDLIYSFVAKKRYKLFGKRESCMIPSPELRSRFME